MSALLDFFRKHELLAVMLIALIGCCVIYGQFLIGDGYYIYADSACDTRDQYVPFYADLVRSIQDGTFSLWNFNYGLGSSLFINQTWTFDVFNLILIPGGLLFGARCLPFLLVFIQCLRVVLCAVLFDRLLVFYCSGLSARLLGATLYAFNGFMLLWGQHYWFASALVWLALVLLLLERAIQNVTALRCTLLSASVAATLTWSLYLGYMILLFSLFYFLIRSAYLPEHFQAKRYLQRVGIFVVVALSGVLISCIVAIPVAQCLLSDSSRIVSEDAPSKMEVALGSLIQFASGEGLALSAGRMLSNNLLGLGMADYPLESFHGGIHVGGSVAVFLFFALYLSWAVKAKVGRRRKVFLFVPALLLLSYGVNEFLPQLFYLFNGADYRSSFVLVPVVCLMMAFVADRIIRPRAYGILSLAAGLLFTLAVLVVSWFFCVPGVHRVIAMETVFLLAVFTALGIYLKGGVFLAYVCALVAIILSSIFDGYVTVDVRDYLDDPEYVPITELAEQDNDTIEALAFAEQAAEGLYRVEKLYTEFTPAMDSFVQGNWGVSSYNSTLSRGVEAFYQEMLPGALLGARTDVQYYAEDPFDPAVNAFLGIHYLLARFELPEDGYVQIAQFGRVRVYELDSTTSSIGHLYAATISADAYEVLSADERRVLVNAVVVEDDALAGGDASVTPTPIDLELINGCMVQGSYDSDSDLTAAISIPYNRGWNVYLDDEPVDVELVNYGFIGFDAPAGTHSIKLTYEPYGWQAGALLSVVGLLLLLAQALVLKRYPSVAKVVE